jgi:purine-binding chemotaxis protein CheW
MEKFVVFRLGGEEFGISINRVTEILRSQKINPLPELPYFLSGVITLRGSVIPLMDMRKRFSLASSPKNERIIVVKSEGDKIGLIVDEVKEIIFLKEDEITNPPSIFKGLRTEYLTGIGRKESKVIILLNLDGLLTTEEKIALKESEDSRVEA